MLYRKGLNALFFLALVNNLGALEYCHGTKLSIAMIIAAYLF